MDLKYGHYKSGYTSHSTLGLVICGQEDGNTDTEKCETTLDGNVMEVASKSWLRELRIHLIATSSSKYLGFCWLAKCNEFPLSSGARKWRPLHGWRRGKKTNTLSYRVIKVSLIGPYYSAYWRLSCRCLIFFIVTVTLFVRFCDLLDFVTIWNLFHGSHKIR